MVPCPNSEWLHPPIALRGFSGKTGIKYSCWCIFLGLAILSPVYFVIDTQTDVLSGIGGGVHHNLDTVHTTNNSKVLGISMNVYM